MRERRGASCPPTKKICHLSANHTTHGNRNLRRGKCPTQERERERERKTERQKDRKREREKDRERKKEKGRMVANSVPILIRRQRERDKKRDRERKKEIEREEGF